MNHFNKITLFLNDTSITVVQPFLWLSITQNKEQQSASKVECPCLLQACSVFDHFSSFRSTKRADPIYHYDKHDMKKSILKIPLPLETSDNELTWKPPLRRLHLNPVAQVLVLSADANHGSLALSVCVNEHDVTGSQKAALSSAPASGRENKTRMCRCVLSVSEMANFFNQSDNLMFYGVAAGNVPGYYLIWAR